MKLTRRTTFSSGHRYWLEDRTPEENRRLFGRWASPYNHGHDYALEATVEGPVNPQTGMVINIKDVDAILHNRIVEKFNLKSINDEVPEFKTLPPSLENLASFIWNKLSDWPGDIQLSRVCLYETPALFTDVTMQGGELKVTLTRVYEFCASHRLHSPDLSENENREVFGKCNNPHGHGHNYELEVTVCGPIDPVTGMMADLEKIDHVVDAEVVDRYDHKHLNIDLPELSGLIPTTEIMTRVIWKRLVGKLPAKLERIMLRETARSSFEYAGEDE
ncbi:MAG: 6-carboxytetrahydropterin synthase [Armatimonadetes bacterium]|nr:6-carboxytetrahydropterin synthase [Armatimonadota bacterium]